MPSQGGTPGSRPPDNQAQGHRPPQVAPATAIRGKVREEGGHGLLRGEAARTPLTTVQNGPQMKGWVLEKRPTSVPVKNLLFNTAFPPALSNEVKKAECSRRKLS